MADSRVCAITVPYPGVRQWLEHGYREKLWNYILLDGQVDLEVPKCDWIMLGAWHPSYQAIVEAARKEGIRVAVAWSSSPTEMEHAPVEINAVLDLQRSGLVDAWMCLQKDMADHFPNGIHLPAPVNLAPAPGPVEQDGIAFYAPATLKKNIFPQLLAIRKAQRHFPNAKLYTNLAPYKPVLDGYGIQYELQGWVKSHADHLARLARRRVAMCASHAESFCYGASDAMMMGLPVVAAPTLDWTPIFWRASNPNSPDAIYAVLSQHLEDQGDLPKKKPRQWIEGVAAHNNAAAAAAIEKMLAVQ